MIPDWVWVPIVSGASVLLLWVLMVLTPKVRGLRDIKIGPVQGVFISPSVANPDSPAAVKAHQVYLMLPRLRQCKINAYLHFLMRKMVAHGIPEDRAKSLLTGNIDFAHYEQCLNSIIWSGNGINSAKSILEDIIAKGSLQEYHEIMEKDRDTVKAEKWLDDKIEETVETMDVSNSYYLRRNYLNMNTDGTGATVLRFVTNEEVYEVDKANRPAITEIVRDIVLAIL